MGMLNSTNMSLILFSVVINHGPRIDILPYFYVPLFTTEDEVKAVQVSLKKRIGSKGDKQRPLISQGWPQKVYHIIVSFFNVVA